MGIYCSLASVICSNVNVDRSAGSMKSRFLGGKSTIRESFYRGFTKSG